MARGIDGAKEQFWRDMLQRWRHSGLSVRAFCARHGLSEPSFYAWRKTLARRDPPAAPAHGPPNDQRPGGSESREPVFVPVRLVPTTPAVLEVVLADCTVRVPAGFDPAALRQLLALLREGPPC